MGEDLLYQVQVFKFGSEDDEVEGGLGLQLAGLRVDGVEVLEGVGRVPYPTLPYPTLSSLPYPTLPTLPYLEGVGGARHVTQLPVDLSLNTERT